MKKVESKETTEPPVATAPEATAPEAAEINPASPPTESPGPASPLPKPPGFATRMMRAIDRALSAEPKRTGWELTSFAALDSSGEEDLICTPGHKEKFIQADLQRAKALQVINTHTHVQAKEAWLAHGARVIQPAVQSGTLADHDAWTFQDWQEDYQEKLDSAKEDLRRIYREIIGDVQEIAEGYCRVAERIAADREASERDFHERYGVPYSGPSAAVVAIRSTIKTARARAEKNEYGTSGPRELMPYLTL